MRKIAISLLLMFLSVSAFAGNHDKLIGEWALDVEKMKKASDEFKEVMKDPNMAEKLANTSRKFTKTEMSFLSLAPDGKLKELKVPYTIVSDKDKTLKIKIANEGGPERIITFTFLDDNNIEENVNIKSIGPKVHTFFTKMEVKK